MNKNTKVYFGDKQLKVVKTRKPMSNKMFAVLVVIMLGLICLYMFFPRTNTVVVTKEIEVVKEVTVKAKVLERIAQCESGNSHYDKNGQVMLNGNKNGSSDIGKYQINTRIWGKKATEMGLNLAIESDNETFAQYLFNTYGSEPWIWSRPCWNR